MPHSKNLLVYNSVFPPLYSLQNVTTPVALFSSDWDLMVTSMDTKTLSLGLPNLIYEKKMRPLYNHGDFFLNAENSDLFKEFPMEKWERDLANQWRLMGGVTLYLKPLQRGQSVHNPTNHFLLLVR